MIIWFVTFILFLTLIILILTLKLSKSQKEVSFFAQKCQQIEESCNYYGKIEANLNPHLLKNILNSIQSHAYQTYYSMDKLSSVLDFILYEGRRQFVSPQKEIEFALNLVEINKIKISPLFNLQVKTLIGDNEPLFTQEILAPLISIDLIENAFKHADFIGVDAFISILIEFKSDIFSITVTNKIGEMPKTENPKSGLGSKMLEERLKVIYSNYYSLDKEIRDNVYFAQLKINLLEYKAQMYIAR